MNVIYNQEPKTNHFYYKIDRQREQQQRVYRAKPNCMFNYWTGQVLVEDITTQNWVT